MPFDYTQSKTIPSPSGMRQKRFPNDNELFFGGRKIADALRGRGGTTYSKLKKENIGRSSMERRAFASDLDSLKMIPSHANSMVRAGLKNSTVRSELKNGMVSDGLKSSHINSFSKNSMVNQDLKNSVTRNPNRTPKPKPAQAPKPPMEILAENIGNIEKGVKKARSMANYNKQPAKQPVQRTGMQNRTVNPGTPNDGQRLYTAKELGLSHIDDTYVPWTVIRGADVTRTDYGGGRAYDKDGNLVPGANPNRIEKYGSDGVTTYDSNDFAAKYFAQGQEHSRAMEKQAAQDQAETERQRIDSGSRLTGTKYTADKNLEAAGKRAVTGAQNKPTAFKHISTEDGIETTYDPNTNTTFKNGIPAQIYNPVMNSVFSENYNVTANQVEQLFRDPKNRKVAKQIMAEIQSINPDGYDEVMRMFNKRKATK